MTTPLQPVASTTSASRSRTPGARLVPVVAVGMLAALTACGGQGSASTSASASPSSSPAASAAGSAAGQPPAGTSGTVAAVSASNAQVQNPTDGQVTVTFRSTTRFTRTVPATRANVTVGSCVTVTSTSTASPSSVPVTALTARSVTVTPATAGSCTAQGGFGGFRGGNASASPGASGSTASPRAPRAGTRVFGKVTSASAAGFIVQGRVGGRSTGSAADVAVTVNPTTSYTSTGAADKSAVTVGSCLTAIGPSDSTGAVTARSVSIRPAGPGGCTVGRRFGGGTATGAATGGGSNG